MDQSLQQRRNQALRRELAAWQRATAGLMALAVAGNVTMYALLRRQEGVATYWQDECFAAIQAEQESVKDLRNLRYQVESDAAQREAQTAAYELLEGYEYIGECKVTHYCCEKYKHACGTGNGITASGLPVAPGMVAVDPDVIPLGSTVIINGVEYLAADTGVNGQHIDIAVPTHSQADELGTYAADVWVVRK